MSDVSGIGPSRDDGRPRAVRYGKLHRGRRRALEHALNARLCVFTHDLLPGLVRIVTSWDPDNRAWASARSRGYRDPFVVAWSSDVLYLPELYLEQVVCLLNDHSEIVPSFGTTGRSELFRVSVDAARAAIEWAIAETFVERPAAPATESRTAWSVACPRCLVAAGSDCVSASGERGSPTHLARWRAVGVERPSQADRERYQEEARRGR